jgi:D-arabinose 1-dehydrogenase-like Zn-dependent alcohol dehydrogenase
VQIAKAFGAEVTGVCSTKNLELVRSIGADHVIDYTQEDFRDGADRYDVILDNVGDRSMADTRRALTQNGTLLSNGGGHAAGKLGRVIRGFLASLIVRQQARPSVKTQNRTDLIALKELVEAGGVRPVIGGTYPLGRTADAISQVAAGHARGTLVIAVSHLQHAVVDPGAFKRQSQPPPTLAKHQEPPHVDHDPGSNANRGSSGSLHVLDHRNKGIRHDVSECNPH